MQNNSTQHEIALLQKHGHQGRAWMRVCMQEARLQQLDEVAIEQCVAQGAHVRRSRFAQLLTCSAGPVRRCGCLGSRSVARACSKGPRCTRNHRTKNIALSSVGLQVAKLLMFTYMISAYWLKGRMNSLPIC